MTIPASYAAFVNWAGLADMLGRDRIPRPCEMCAIKGGEHIEADGGCRHRMSDEMWVRFVAGGPDAQRNDDPRTQPVTMTVDDAANQLSNAIYKASELLERLEGAGRLLGNGHHARQKLAEHAVNELRLRWRQ